MFACMVKLLPADLSDMGSHSCRNQSQMICMTVYDVCQLSDCCAVVMKCGDLLATLFAFIGILLYCAGGMGNAWDMYR